MSVAEKPSQEEIMAELHAAAVEGRDPFDWKRTAAPRPIEGETATDEDLDLFSPADLTPGVLRLGVRYQIPNSQKFVWVHPTSGYDAELIINWGARGKAPLEPGLERQPNPGGEIIDPLVNQCICCLRDGPQQGARRIFDLRQAPALKAMLSYETLTEIVKLSGSLGTGTEALGEAARGFFGVIEGVLSSVPGVLDTCEDCPDGLKDRVTLVLSELQRLLLRGSFSSRE